MTQTKRVCVCVVFVRPAPAPAAAALRAVRPRETVALTTLMINMFKLNYLRLLPLIMATTS